MPGPGEAGCTRFQSSKDIKRQWPQLKYLPRPEPSKEQVEEHKKWRREYSHWQGLECNQQRGAYFCRRHGEWITCEDLAAGLASKQKHEEKYPSKHRCPPQHYGAEEQPAELGTFAQHHADTIASSAYPTQVNTNTVEGDLPKFDKLSLEDADTSSPSYAHPDYTAYPGSTGYPGYPNYPSYPDYPGYPASTNTAAPAYTSQSSSKNLIPMYGGGNFTATDQSEPSLDAAPNVGNLDHLSNSGPENSGYIPTGSNQATEWNSTQQPAHDSYYTDPNTAGNMPPNTYTGTGKHPAETHSKRQDRRRSSGQSTSRHDGKNSVSQGSKSSRHEHKGSSSSHSHEHKGSSSSHRRVTSHDSKSSSTKSKTSNPPQTMNYSQSTTSTETQQPPAEYVDYGEYPTDGWYNYDVPGNYPSSGQSVYYNNPDQTYNTSEPVYITSGQVYPVEEGAEQQSQPYNVGDGREQDYGHGSH